MQLVIAEKPSVARDLARVLGMRASGRNAVEGGDRVITWCIGHLVELEEPVAYDPSWKAWRMDTLPMIPVRFKLRAVSGTRDQLRVVRELLRDRRFTEVVNACDAGREGELIFRYVYELAGSRLPVRRLWISSLTDEAIRGGFAALRPGSAYDDLADAARSRSEADWLVGMNATRAVTLQFRARGGDAPAPVYSIGRVQTPTLAILVAREQAIRGFKPQDYWEVRGTFTTAVSAPAAGEDGATRSTEKGAAFTALWTVRAGADRRPITRLSLRTLAEQVVSRAAALASAADPGGPVVESLVQKQTREPPPQLFDLTSLQRTANRRFGLSAKSTLEAAQALYERHKVLTYPRTDSRHLPEDMRGELPKLFRALAQLPTYETFATPLVGGSLAQAAGSATRSRRIFDATKVHDHHAIIPTAKLPAPGALGRDEQRIYDLVVRRFLGAFHPDAEFASTEAVIRVGTPDNEQPSAGKAAHTGSVVGPASTPAPQAVPKPNQNQGQAPEETLLAVLPPPPDRFTARGRTRLVAGWQDVAGFDDGPAKPAGSPGGSTMRAPGGTGSPRRSDSSGGGGVEQMAATLPVLARGQRLEGRFQAHAHQTRPPPRHTEATLLGAMESAGREIEDEALRAAMKDTGLGTPATRAATIETLLKRGFISREGKQVAPTPVGMSLIERLPVVSLASPELTGAWEARLVAIARGQQTRAAFMTDIAVYVRQVTDAVRQSPSAGQRGQAIKAPPPVAAAAPVKDLRCPRCGQGGILAGTRGWGCSRWREGCPFVIWFQIGDKRVSATQLRDLIEKGKTRKSAAGRLVLDLTASREQGAARLTPG